MSSWETHRGILKEIDLVAQGLTVREFLLSKVENRSDWEDEGWSELDILYNNYLDEKYIIVNGKIYEWLNHTRKFDEEESFCMLAPKPDGTIEIFSQFYNGGTCIDEMIEDELKRYENNKE